MIRKRSLSKAELARGKAKKELKSKLFLFCEGKVTETLYLQTIAREISTTVLSIERFGAAPSKLADWASAHQKIMKANPNKFTKNDSIWVVFDKDDHPLVDETINRLKSLGIGVAYSNPCFELWLIYHFCDHDAPIGREEAKSKLGGLTPDYCKKNKKLISAQNLSKSVNDAVKRSKKSVEDRAAEGKKLACPCSTVYELIEAMERPSAKP